MQCFLETYALITTLPFFFFFKAEVFNEIALGNTNLDPYFQTSIK